MAGRGYDLSSRDDVYNLFLYDPTFTRMVQTVSKDSIAFAKPALLLGRFGRLPLQSDSALGRRLAPFLSAFLDDGRRDRARVPRNPHRGEGSLHDIELFLKNPFNRGVLVHYALLKEFDPDEENHIKLQSVQKEVHVMDSERFAPAICWQAILRPENGLSLHPDIPYNRKALEEVGYHIDGWIARLSRISIFPTMSRKLLPSRARTALEKYSYWLREPFPLYTQASLERLYIKLGVHAEGPCQMSQRWYTNGQVPRTYFVAGETAYTHAKYTKVIFNRLADCLPSTERRKRVDISRLRIPSDRYSMAFYDFSSFTSNAGFQAGMLRALAEYTRKDEVTIVDGRLGFVPMSLGDLIEDYVDHVNECPEYYSEIPGFDDLIPNVHRPAGFLGVNGNIATCTFGHGAILRQFVEDENQSGCAGDDAAYVYYLVDGWRKDLQGLTLMGVLAEEKVYDLAENGDAVYLKRGVEFNTPHQLRLSPFIQLPSFLFMYPSRLSRYRENTLEGTDLRRIAVNSLSAFFSSVRTCKPYTSAEEDQIRNFALLYYEWLHIPSEGYAPFVSHPEYVSPNFKDLLIPAVSALFSEDFILETYIQQYQGSCTLPVVENETAMVWIDIRYVHSFRAVPSAQLAYLVRIGLLVRGRISTRVVHGEGGLAELCARIDEKKLTRGCLYEYSVVDTIPELAPELLMIMGEPLGTLPVDTYNSGTNIFPPTGLAEKY